MARRGADPAAVLRATRLDANALAQRAGHKRLLSVLRRAQADLDARLRRAEGLGGPGRDSFSAAQMRAALEQVRVVLRDLKGGMRSVVLDQGELAAGRSVDETLRYLRAAERRFTGVSQRLPLREAAMLDRAVKGTESSLLHRLESDPKRGPGILDRYGDQVVQKFEENLQQRFIARQPWEQTRNALIADSPFLQQAPAHWAERIVRTEVMGAHNRASWETIRFADEELGGVVKILSATFDNRTGADSFAVHGQIRRPDQAFESWFGLYQHPPNRPNDREVVVPHRLAWPIPGNLAWKSDSEVAGRWAEEGRKGSPPRRPKMTTVPLDRFGRS